MTNHSNASDEPIREPIREPIPEPRSESVPEPLRDSGALPAPDDHRVTLRSRSELADSLPYLLGYQPENSIVLLAVHGERGRIGRRVRMGIPGAPEDWPATAEQLAASVIDPRGDLSRAVSPQDTDDDAHGQGRPDRLVAFLCQEPEAPSGDSGSGGVTRGQDVMERLRPLAQELRLACGRLDVPVFEALCIAGGRQWSYLCAAPGCCPPEGQPLPAPGTSILAAASVFAGQREPQRIAGIERRLLPWQSAAALDQERALDAAAQALLPTLVGSPRDRAEARDQTLGLITLLIGRLSAAADPERLAPEKADPAGRDVPSDPGVPSGRGLPAGRGSAGQDPLEADLRDDELLAHDEAAAVLLGLQDRTTRDHAAAWMEGASAQAARRLWRALARRCVGPYAEYAAAPLALTGWVSWSLGDLTEGRLALHLALAVDPRYVFAVLLDEACDRGVDVEAIRHYLRRTCRGHEHVGMSPSVEPSSEGRSAQHGEPAKRVDPAKRVKAAHGERAGAGHVRRAPRPTRAAGERPPGGPTAPRGRTGGNGKKGGGAARRRPTGPLGPSRPGARRTAGRYRPETGAVAAPSDAPDRLMRAERQALEEEAAGAAEEAQPELPGDAAVETEGSASGVVGKAGSGECAD